MRYTCLKFINNMVSYFQQELNKIDSKGVVSLLTKPSILPKYFSMGFTNQYIYKKQ